MTKPNDPAFSRAAFYHPDGGYVPAQEGMTKREYFAAMAMQGYISCREFDKYNEELLAMCSVVQADALIKVLNETNPTENETTTNTH